MTREEIEELKGLASSMGLYDDKNPCKRAVILGKAIKALEQEPCEDVISRQAALDGLARIAKVKAKSDAQKALMGRVMFFTEQLPPVTPTACIAKVTFDKDELQKIVDEKVKELTLTQEWIPVSEKVPEKNVEVLATTEWGAVTIAEMYSANDWFIHEGTTNAETDEIVAWMSLPKPYEECI